MKGACSGSRPCVVVSLGDSRKASVIYDDALKSSSVLQDPEQCVIETIHHDIPHANERSDAALFAFVLRLSAGMRSAQRFQD